MPKPWPARELAVVLPIATAKAMFERVERFDIERGGRDLAGRAPAAGVDAQDRPLTRPGGQVGVVAAAPEELTLGRTGEAVSRQDTGGQRVGR